LKTTANLGAGSPGRQANCEKILMTKPVWLCHATAWQGAWVSILRAWRYAWLVSPSAMTAERLVNEISSWALFGGLNEEGCPEFVWVARSAEEYEAWEAEQRMLRDVLIGSEVVSLLRNMPHGYR
jgi:hypothetical protein